MSSTTSKPPIKDPTRVPSVEDVDRQLGPFSRYARTVRGAARVAGLSARLTWTPSGWIEHLRWGDSLIAMLHLNKSPPTAEVGVSRALEETLVPRLTSDLLKKFIHDADGTNIKWVEVELTAPEPAEAMATLVSLKSELITSGVVPLSPAERTKAIVRPAPEQPPRLMPIAANRPPTGARTEPKARPKPEPKAKTSAARRPAPQRGPVKKSSSAKAHPKVKAAAKRRR